MVNEILTKDFRKLKEDWDKAALSNSFRDYIAQGFKEEDAFRKSGEHATKWIRKFLNHYEVDWKDKRVAELGCFVENTRITMADFSEKNIKDINIGDKVLSSMGEINEVINVFKRKIKKTIKLELPYIEEIETTKEHPFLSIKKEDIRCKSLRNRTHNTNGINGSCQKCGTSDIYNPSFHKISELIPGDFVSIFRGKNNNQLDKKQIAWAKLLGYYLAEGHILYSYKTKTKIPKIQGCGFTLNIIESNIAKEIKELAKELGTTHVVLKRRPDKNTLDIRIQDKKIGEEMLRMGGRYSYHKRINKEVFNFCSESKRLIIQNWLRGDGHYRYVKNKGERYTGTSMSKQLLKDIQRLAWSLGICPSIYNEKVDFHGQDCEYFIKRKKSYISHKRYRTNNDYIFIPINDLKILHNTKTVYNLSVSNDNTYISNGLVVHNCGAGRITEFIAKEASHVQAIDISAKMLKRLHERLGHQQNIETLCIIRDFSVIGDLSVNLIISYLVFQHVPEKMVEKLIQDGRRILKEGGYYFFQIPLSKNHKCDPCNDANALDMVYWTLDEVEELATKYHFKIIAKPKNGKSQFFLFKKI